MPKRVLKSVQNNGANWGPSGLLHFSPQPGPATPKLSMDFLKFLRFNGHSLPRERDYMDALVCEYVEHLWSSGAGRAVASDTVAGLQDVTPKLRGVPSWLLEIVKDVGSKRSAKPGTTSA